MNGPEKYLNYPGDDMLLRRRIWISWGAAVLSIICLVILNPFRDSMLVIQFSICMFLLTIVCFRWWTSPVHPGIFCFLSPHTIILFHGFIYYGIGNIFIFAYPDQYVINYGAKEFYLPVMFIFTAALWIFDFTYRIMIKWLSVNDYLQSAYNKFFSDKIQSVFSSYALTWYLICTAVFIYMTRTYFMHSFTFVGADEEGANILAKSSPYLLSISWIIISMLIIRQKKLGGKLLLGLLLLLLLPQFFSFQSRRMLVYCSLISALTYGLFSRKGLHFKSVIIIGVIVVGLFMLLWMVKVIGVTDRSVQRYRQEEKSIFIRTSSLIGSEQLTRISNAQNLLLQNLKKRVTGLDFPAAIMNAHLNYGITFMYGRHNLLVTTKTIPRLFWPGKPKQGTQGEIIQHFELAQFDQTVSIFSSLYADGGIIGVIIGAGILSVFLAWVERLVFSRGDGIIVYILALPILAQFETYFAKYCILWLRWIIIIMIVNSVIYHIYNALVISRKPST